MQHLVPEFIAKIGSYTTTELLLLKKEVQHVQLRKNEILLQKGEVCSSVSFVVTGAMFQYKFDTDLEQHIMDLHATHHWVMNQKSFTARAPSEYTIEAFEDTTLYTLTIESIHY